MNFFFFEKSNFIKYLNKIKSINSKLLYFLDMINLLKDDYDIILFNELCNLIKLLKDDIDDFEIETLFLSIDDNLNAFIDIQAGSGGVDAQDWSEILLKMYLSWFDKKCFKYSIIDISYSDNIGIKMVSIKVIGKFVYGWLKHETGIHRLVRKSPFDANKKRHTSFASVFVYPVTYNVDLVINDNDIKIDTFRSSGAGGQHVNKTDSAVRLIHVPTKIVVQCQSERSQHKNKIKALEQLKLKFFALSLLNASNFNFKKKMSITWGNQIRSYVFDKSYIKDVRTNLEVNDINFILNGNLDIFILSILNF